MRDQSAAIAAAVRAVCGESDLDAVMPALDDAGPARVIACAPKADRVVRAVAVLCGGLPSLLDAPTVADPALHDAVAHLIGTPAGRAALRAWAAVAPANWGRLHATALCNAVRSSMCDPAVAAALIGPGDDAAPLLRSSEDIAFAIRRWGLSAPTAPTAWSNALSAEERRRLLDAALRSPFACAACLPWLPPDAAPATNRANDGANAALDAFAVASPTARTLHADRIRQLVADARPERLAELTRLACVMQIDEVWNRVQMLIRESPDDAWRVVVAAPWDDLADDVRDVILACADTSDGCAAVAAAREQRDSAAMDITRETAIAFFAALDPRVWDAFDAATRQRWLQALPYGDAHLAVRSLGLRAEVLARAALDNDLVRAVQRHARGEGAWLATLLPVALRNLPLAAAHTVIAALPLPPDPGAFFCIAGERADPEVLAPARATLRTPDALALAVVLQRSGAGGASIRACCSAAQHALRGRSYDDLAPILALLSADARAALMPDDAALARRLAHPYRLDTLRQALARLADLPPAVAIPTSIALTRWTPWNAADASAAGADALRAHGDVFLTLTDALAHTEALMHDDLRHALLPLPEDAAHANALRSLARDDPPTAQRLARALRDRSWRDALLALLAAPAAHANAVWQAISDDARRAIGAVVAAAPPEADPLAVFDPIAALALAAAQSTDADLRDAVGAAMAARPDVTRAIWEQLPPDVQRDLGALPACADLPPTPTRLAVRRERLRGRR